MNKHNKQTENKRSPEGGQEEHQTSQVHASRTKERNVHERQKNNAEKVSLRCNDFVLARKMEMLNFTI